MLLNANPLENLYPYICDKLVLEITMAKIFDAEFIEVSAQVLRRIEGTFPFDVYIRRAANTYTKLFPKGEKSDSTRIDHYETKKISSFYVTQNEYKQYLLYVEELANHVLSQDPSKTPTDDLVHIVKEMTSLTILEITHQTQLEEEAIGHASQTINGCIQLLAKDPGSFAKLFSLIANHPYVLKHSLSTSLFAILLCKALNMNSTKTLNAVGMGGFLHDIGMSRVPFDVEEKGELTSEEWKLVKEHPHIGKFMLDTIKHIPAEVRSIVIQHHEQPNGAGYPNGLHDKDIFYLAKVIAVTDTFSALVSKRPYRESPFSPLQALETMSADMGKYDPAILAAFRSIFIRTTPS